MGTAITIILYLLGVLLYIIPSYIAFERKVQSKILVLLINVFLGWTIIGWIVALLIAYHSEDGRPQSLSLKNNLAQIKYCEKCNKSVNEIGKTVTGYVDSELIYDLMDMLKLESKEFLREQKWRSSKLDSLDYCESCTKKVRFCIHDFWNTYAKALVGNPQKAECPYCSELIETNLQKCPCCAESLE